MPDMMSFLHVSGKLPLFHRTLIQVNVLQAQSGGRLRPVSWQVKLFDDVGQVFLVTDLGHDGAGLKRQDLVDELGAYDWEACWDHQADKKS